MKTEIAGFVLSEDTSNPDLTISNPFVPELFHAPVIGRNELL
jgi:hypothetical protein